MSPSKILHVSNEGLKRPKVEDLIREILQVSGEFNSESLFYKWTTFSLKSVYGCQMMPSKSAGAEHFLFAIQDLTQQTSPLLCVFNECLVHISVQLKNTSPYVLSNLQ